MKRLMTLVIGKPGDPRTCANATSQSATAMRALGLTLETFTCRPCGKKMRAVQK